MDWHLGGLTAWATRWPIFPGADKLQGNYSLHRARFTVHPRILGGWAVDRAEACSRVLADPGPPFGSGRTSPRWLWRSLRDRAERGTPHRIAVEDHPRLKAVLRRRAPADGLVEVDLMAGEPRSHQVAAELPRKKKKKKKKNRPR
ncbi:hypothetical protein ACU686_29470 [Yinghuangia aomiensis]